MISCLVADLPCPAAAPGVRHHYFQRYCKAAGNVRAYPKFRVADICIEESRAAHRGRVVIAAQREMDSRVFAIGRRHARTSDVARLTVRCLAMTRRALEAPP
jgi:hypothetical protein